jgi:hypothetical protein
MMSPKQTQMVYLAAHELRHLFQAAVNRPKSARLPMVWGSKGQVQRSGYGGIRDSHAAGVEAASMSRVRDHLLF